MLEHDHHRPQVRRVDQDVPDQPRGLQPRSVHQRWHDLCRWNYWTGYSRCQRKRSVFSQAKLKAQRRHAAHSRHQGARCSGVHTRIHSADRFQIHSDFAIVGDEFLKSWYTVFNYAETSSSAPAVGFATNV